MVGNCFYIYVGSIKEMVTILCILKTYRVSCCNCIIVGKLWSSCFLLGDSFYFSGLMPFQMELRDSNPVLNE